jgi:hypothetical protein
MDAQTYDARMKQIGENIRGNPVLTALHESVTLPYDMRKWSDILYPRIRVAPQPPPQPHAQTNQTNHVIHVNEKKHQ